MESDIKEYKNAVLLLRAIDDVMESGIPQTMLFIYRGQDVRLWCGVGSEARDVTERITQLQARVRELEEALQGFIDPANESQGITGWHLNGDVLLWEAVDQLTVAHDLLHPTKGTP